MTKIGDRADDLEKLHDTLKKQGMALRKELIRSVKSDTGGDAALSGIGNKPRLGVTLRTTKGKRTSTVVLKPSPRAAKGPWSWLDQGTRAGMRRSKGQRGRITRRESQVTGSGAYYHEGTKGKRTWFGTTDPFLKKHEAEMARRFDVASR